MKVFFVTDHPFSEKDGLYYSGGGLPSEAWNRYLLNDNYLYVIGRRSKISNLTLSSRNRVSFCLLNNYSRPKDALLKYSIVKKELNDYLNRSDCVILRLPSVLGLISLQICKKNRIPYLIEVVADAFDSYYNYGTLIGRFSAPIYDYLIRKAVFPCKYILYVTREYLQTRYPHSEHSLSIGITNANINPVSDEIMNYRIDKINKMSLASVKCGQIGNLNVRYKGYHVMLKALSILKNEGLSVSYHIVGGGDSDDILKEASKLNVDDMVVIRGKLPHDEIDRFLDEIDIYVHPSYQEGLPRVVVEAISRGCPCLTSNVAGTPELISEKYLHNCGDYEKLYSDIKRLIFHKNEMKAAANENFNHAKEYYSPVLDQKRRVFYNMFFLEAENERQGDK